MLYKIDIKIGYNLENKKRPYKLHFCATYRQKKAMTPASEAAYEQLTYDAVIKKTFTRITECPPTR